MRALLNIIAILAIVAAAYGIGILNHKMRFSAVPTVEKPHQKKIDWVKSDWYMNDDGHEFRDAKGKINQARGCKSASGFIANGNTRVLNPAPAPAEPANTEESK